MSGSAKGKHAFVKAAVVILILIAAAVVALPFVIDANQFKPQLQAKLSAAVGREITVESIKLSVLSGSVGVEEIAIADNPSFSQAPFLTAKSLKAAVELWPLLFSRSLRIKGITIDQPEITLIRSEEGSWNISDLGGKETETVPQKVEGRTDAGSGTTTAKELSIKQFKIVGGRVTTIRKSGDQKPSIYKDVNLTVTNLSLGSSFPFTLTASLPGEGTLKLNGSAGPLNQRDIIRTPLSAEIEVEKCDLVASGFVPPDSGLSGSINFGGNIESDGTKVRSRGRAAADKLQVVRSGRPAANPVSVGYGAEYDLTRRSGMLNDVKITSGNATANLSGTYDAAGANLMLKMRMHGANMPVQDLATLLPAFGVLLPKGASLQGGSLNADLAAEGPIDRIVTTGWAEVFKTRLVGFDLAGKLAAVAFLAGIRSSQDAEIEKFHSAFQMTPDGIQVSDLILTVPALGELTGHGEIANDQSLDFKMHATLKPGGVLGDGIARLVKGGALNIPFSVKGNSADPKFVPDLKKGAGGLLGGSGGTSDSLGNTLRNLLQKKR